MAGSAKDLRHGAESAMNEGREKAAAGLEKAKEAGAQVMERAGDMASQAAHSTRRMAENLGERAEDGVAAVGGGIKSLAEDIRQRGPHGGFMGTATGAVANTLDSTGEYLETHGLSGIGEDMTAMVRRNPIPCLFAAAAVGFLLARASRS